MKNKKILAEILLIITIATLVVPMFSFSTFAEGEVAEGEQNIVSGDNLYFSADTLTLYPGLVNDGDEIEVNCDFYGLLTGTHYSAIRFKYVVPILDDNEPYMKIYFIKSEQTEGDTFDYFYGPLIMGVFVDYWNDQLKFITFTSDVTDETLKTWLLENCSFVTDTDSAYYKIGYDDGYNFGYVVGNNDGKEEGIAIGESSSFGQNLLGDTLKAPVDALDSLVLYRTSFGFDVTLWGIVGALIGFGLFVWFLKMFAGG